MTDDAIMKELRNAKNVVAIRLGEDANHDDTGAGKGKKGGSARQQKRLPHRPIIIIVIGNGGACFREERPEGTVYFCGGPW
jgi:hypothetical protein